jgi:hypothetical protein
MNKPLLFLMLVLCLNVVVAQEYLLDADEFSDSNNAFLDSAENRISMLFPAILLLIAIIFAVLDFGAVGVVIGCLVGLIVTVLIGFVAVSTFSLISFVIMGGILVFKLS